MEKKVVRCVLQKNEPIFESECPVKKGDLKPNKQCQYCKLSESPKSNLRQATEEPPQTANDPVRMKVGRWFDDPTSIANTQEAFKRHYEEDNNPLHFMLAFNHAVEYGVAVPQ